MRFDIRLVQRHLVILIVAFVAMIVSGIAHAATTVSFQNGINGYTGTFDRYISEEEGAAEVNGSTVPSYVLSALNQGATTTPDRQGLIRFDNIFGTDPGQIPMGAFILDAQLQLVTTGGPAPIDAGNATGGPFGVAGLLAPFDSTTSYFDDYPSDDPEALGGRGAWWVDGHATRPVGGYGRQNLGEVSQARVASLVQQWSDGTLANNGMVVQAGFQGTGDADGWGIYTTGFGTAVARPKLTVTYTTDEIEVNSFQPGVGSYDVSNVTMARVLGSSTADPEQTTDGTSITGGTFLDFPEPAVREQLALVKFDDVFGSGEDQAPADKPVAKGWLVITSGNSSDNARSPDIFDVHIMNTAWNTSSLHSSFGTTPGLQIAEGEISEALDLDNRPIGRVSGSEVWYDVTEYLEKARTNPGSDNGLAIIAKDTDGWEVLFNGANTANARPRLVVASQLSSSAPGGGDFNNDGNVDGADYVMWQKTNSGDTGAYNTWKENFGSSGGGPSEPEQPDVVANYDLVGIMGPVATAPATRTSEGVTGLPLSRGAGLAAGGLTHGFSASNWTNTAADGGTVDRARAIANNDYFQWGFTLDGSHTASLSETEISSRRSATNGPSNYELQVSLDGFATPGIVVESFTYFGRVSGNAPTPNPTLTDPLYYMSGTLTGSGGRPDTVTTPSDPFPTVDLSDIPQLQDIAPGTTVTFRLYAWNDGQAGSANSNTVAFRMTGPRITGEVTSISGSGGVVPEPASALMAGIVGVAFALGRRTRRLRCD